MKVLESKFIGIGEVKGYEFTQINDSTTAYMYLIESGGKKVHYEVFKRLNVPVCIDFKKRIYSETEFKEVYPKSKNFGFWAWTFYNYQNAFKKFTEL